MPRKTIATVEPEVITELDEPLDGDSSNVPVQELTPAELDEPISNADLNPVKPATKSRKKRGKSEQTSPQTQPIEATCEQSTLAAVLSYARPLIPSKPQIPALGTFLVSLEPNQLSVTATDLTTYIKASTTISLLQPSRISLCVPPELADIASRAAAGELELSVTQSDTPALSITDQQGGTTKLSCLPSTDYPSLEFGGTPCLLPATIVLTALKNAAVAASRDDNKEMLKSIFWKLDIAAQTLHCIATDGNRVVQATSDLSGSGRPIIDGTSEAPVIECILRLPLVERLCTLLSRIAATHIEFYCTPEWALFRVPVSETITVEIGCRCISGIYPDVSTLLTREEYPNVVTMDRPGLIQKLERVTALAPKDLIAVVLTFEADTLRLSREAQTGETQQVIALTSQSTAVREITFNAQFLLTLLKAMDSSEVEIAMSSARWLAKFSFAGDCPTHSLVDATHYCMPMQTRQDASKEEPS